MSQHLSLAEKNKKAALMDGFFIKFQIVRYGGAGAHRTKPSKSIKKPQEATREAASGLAFVSQQKTCYNSQYHLFPEPSGPTSGPTQKTGIGEK